jgi:uncharacterized damage-inducible protein DinB
LDVVEYRKERRGSFGSIHGVLNHVLLGDRIWMARFEGGEHRTPALNTVLYEDFLALRSARIEQDAHIEAFFDRLESDFLSRSLRYTNSQAGEFVEASAIAIAHFFNHQTHHRGQVHVMLSQTSVQPPSLDMHRILNPFPAASSQY